MRFANLDEIVMATFYDDAEETWDVKACTVEDVLCSVCEEYTEYEAEPYAESQRESVQDVPDMNVGDMISRQDAIEAMANAIWHYPNLSFLSDYDHARELAEDALKRLSSAYSDEKIQMMQEFERAQIAAKAYELGKAESERKTGKWIQISPAKIYECSECGQNVMTDDIECYKYCHGCGAEMGGEQDDN